MYSTILVPLDGSKRAEAILPHVEELAQRYGTKVIFIQVVAPAPSGVGLRGVHLAPYHRRRGEARSYLAARQGEFREKGIKAQIHVIDGSIVEAIIDAAEREGVDLIAIASHGRAGLSQMLYGSVAAGVLCRVDRPLLLIRSRSDERNQRFEA